jgi:hypothetical protein
MSGRCEGSDALDCAGIARIIASHRGFLRADALRLKQSRGRLI